MILPLLLSTLALASNSACEDQRVDSTWGIVHAHRGMGHGAGENTIAAFKQAVEAGADVLELDLQVTKDQQLAIRHDATIGEGCTQAGAPVVDPNPIGGLTAEELKAFDCGGAVPMFRDFLAAFKDSKVRFNVEMKANAEVPAKADDFAKLVVAELRQAGIFDRMIIQSFDLGYLKALRAELAESEKKQLQLAFLFMDLKYNFTDWVKLAVDNELQILSPNEWKLPFKRSTVEALHKAKVKLIPYAPDEEWQWKRYLSLGVDGMHTNKPKELIAFLKANPMWSCLTNAP